MRALLITVALVAAAAQASPAKNQDDCVLPDCSKFSTESPLGGDPTNVPQIVVISFDDAITVSNIELYNYISRTKNPNGCNISMTFFVSHEYTDYTLVNDLHRRGHEIAIHSVTHFPDVDNYWKVMNETVWSHEIGDARDIIAKYGLIPKEDLKGFRAPFLVVGGDDMFTALHETGMKYDCSWPTLRYTNWYTGAGDEKPLGAVFPFTMDSIPPLDTPTAGEAPSNTYPSFWVAPMLDLQDDRGEACAMLDACQGDAFNCSSPACQDDLYQVLKDNFDVNYFSNRAPFGLYSHESWFHTGYGNNHQTAYLRFLGYLNSLPDVWIVSMDKLIQWMEKPTSNEDIEDFPPFQCSSSPPTSNCVDTKNCRLPFNDLTRFMNICGRDCPEVYPWIYNVNGIKD